MSVPGALLEMWAAAIWRASWQGGLLAAAVWIILRYCPPMPARFQAWLWRLATLKFPIALLWATPILLPLLPNSPRAAAVEHGSSSAAGNTAALATSPASRETINAGTEPRSVVLAGLFTLWTAGAAMRYGGLFVAWRRAMGLQRTMQPLEQSLDAANLFASSRSLGRQRPPRLGLIDGHGSPLVLGILRPVILVPVRTWQRWNDAERALALEHESAHVQRGDLAWHLLAATVRAAFFFHPAAWLCERRLRLSQELAADERAVARRRCDPLDYARFLLSLVSQRGSVATSSGLSLGATGPRHSLQERISAMQHIGKLGRRGTLLAAGCAAAIAIVGITPWALTQADPVDAESPATAVASEESSLPADAEHPRFHFRVHMIDVSAESFNRTAALQSLGKRPGAWISMQEATALLDAVKATKDASILQAPAVTTSAGRNAEIRYTPTTAPDKDEALPERSVELLPESTGEHCTLRITSRQRPAAAVADVSTRQETCVDVKKFPAQGGAAVLSSGEAEGRRSLVMVVAQTLPPAATPR